MIGTTPHRTPTAAPQAEDLPVVAGVGFLAGDVYRYLGEHGEASFQDLKRALGKAPAMLQMAVGWLAREEKVDIQRKGAGYSIRLRS